MFCKFFLPALLIIITKPHPTGESKPCFLQLHLWWSQLHLSFSHSGACGKFVLTEKKNYGLFDRYEVSIAQIAIDLFPITYIVAFLKYRQDQLWPS
jgi:hypothetical protein